MTQVTVNGNQYSDDNSTARSMNDGGHRTWLLPMISDTMVVINQWLGSAFSTGVRTVTATGAQTVAVSDNIIKWVPAIPAPVTFTLPPNPALGQRHQFVHRQTLAGQIFPMTIVPTAGTINALPNVLVQIPNGHIKLVHLGANDWTVEDSPGAPAPYPNILVNAGMQIDQQNEGTVAAMVTGVKQYGVDQWQAVYTSSAAAGVTVQRVADAPFDSGFSMKVTVGTGAAVGVSDYLLMRQYIESSEITGTGIGTASAVPFFLSFWVKSSIAPYTMCGSLQASGVSRSYPFNVTIITPNVWEQKIIAIARDTAGTYSSGSIVLTAAAGLNYQGTANTWVSANRIATSACTNTLLSISGSTIQITAVKLEAGYTPSPYAPASYARDLMECLRFYEKSYNTGVKAGTVDSAGAVGIRGDDMGNNAGMTVTYITAKRTTPVITMYSPVTGVSGKIRDLDAAADINAALVNGGFKRFSFTTTTVGKGVNMSAHFVADARF